MGITTVPRYPVQIEGETVTIGTASELVVALDVLHGQHDRAVLEQLAPHLAQIVGNANGFAAVIKSLAPDDQRFLIEAVGPALAGVMQDAVHLRDLLAAMAHVEVEETLLRTLGQDGLRALLLTAEQVAEVLEWVYGQCDVLALDLLGIDYLRSLCHHADELSAILHSLDEPLQVRLVEALGWDLVCGLVRDGRDLAYLLRALPADSSQRLLTHFSPAQLRQIIGNAADWDYLVRRLETAEAETLFAMLGVTTDAA